MEVFNIDAVDENITFHIRKTDRLEKDMYISDKNVVNYVGNFDYKDKYQRVISRNFSFYINEENQFDRDEIIRVATLAFKSAYKKVDDEFSEKTE